MKYNKFILNILKDVTGLKSYIAYTFLAVFLIVTYPIVLGAIVSAATDKNLSGLIIYISLYTIISLAIMAAGYTASIKRVNIIVQIRSLMTKKLFANTTEKSIKFVLNNSSGNLSGKIDDIIRTTPFYLRVIFDDIFMTLLMFIGYIAIISYSVPYLGLFLTLTAIFYIYFFKKFSKNITPKSNKNSVAKNKRLSFIVDSISNILLFKSFANEKTENKHLNELVDNEKDSITDLFNYKAKLEAFQFIMRCVILIVTISVASYLLFKGSITIAVFMVIYAAVLNMARKIDIIIRSVDEYFNHIGTLESGLDTLLAYDDINDIKNAKALKITKAEISLKDICFGYNKENIFDSFSLNIKGNEKIALIGKSGAGKSSLVSIIQRFYDINSGNINIDKQDISKVTQNSLHKHISYIPQEPSLLSRSVYDNIAYGKYNASKEEVLNAAKLANVDAFIDKLPNGYDELVGERGFKLSGGQKQRVAIARAILKDAPIIIMDEATSALDSHSEKLIQESLENLMQNKTCIVIAHRLSTIKNMDRVIVLEDGKIAQDGSHLSLVRKKGTYRDLWQLQQDGFITTDQT